MERAQYDTLEDSSYVAIIPGLRGVIATGKTLEECRKDIIEVIGERVVARLRWGHTIPTIGGQTMGFSKELMAVVE